MFESTKRRPRRAVKAGIAAAVAAAAAGGTLFASQAGAANVETANIMLKVRPGAQCARVAVTAPIHVGPGGTVTGGDLVAQKNLDYTKGYYKSTDWNSTGIVAPVGDSVSVFVDYSQPCVNPWAGNGTTYQVVRQGWGDFWVDLSH